MRLTACWCWQYPSEIDYPYHLLQHKVQEITKQVGSFLQEIEEKESRLAEIRERGLAAAQRWKRYQPLL